jgi:hypothetical protein
MLGAGPDSMEPGYLVNNRALHAKGYMSGGPRSGSLDAARPRCVRGLGRFSRKSQFLGVESPAAATIHNEPVDD